jgi:hypothetical protein
MNIVTYQERAVKAHEWHQRGKKTSDPIDAFSNFWHGFNNLYAPMRKRNEREKIQTFLQDSICEERASHLLSTHAGCIDYLLSEPVIDMRGNGKDTAPNIAAFKAATSYLVKLKEVVMVVYQVRCNLVHGQKSPNRPRDVLLCQCATPIIAALIESATREATI